MAMKRCFLSFPKLAKRFGNAALGSKLRFLLLPTGFLIFIAAGGMKTQRCVDESLFL
jgi:hypothetical protein